MERFLGCLFVCLSVLASGHSSQVQDDPFVISVSTDGTYNISIEGTLWLRNAPTFFIVDGKTYSAADGTLKLTETSATSGSDIFGRWQTTNFAYVCPGNNVSVTAIITVYLDQPFILFSQEYPSGANNTKAANYDVTISGFPGFRIEGEQGHLGYLSYGGMMFGDTSKRIGSWSDGTSLINEGIAAGPLAIFDNDGKTLIISPFSNFMAASVSRDQTVGGNMYWGIMGGVESVPAQYRVDHILYYGDGINKAFQGWGEALRMKYGKDPRMQEQDWTIRYLGYWTDNGAFYYYNTEGNKTYEDTMMDVGTYASLTIDVPYRYFQYDSWWYYKGEGEGVKTWEARPDIFPKGFPNLVMQTGKPAAAHNRYWSSDTTYAKQNGGDYDFIIDKPKAVPVDLQFWMDLFEEAKSWDLILYEQDWLNVEFSGVRPLLENITLGSTWLNQMGHAAEYKDIFIQYCMSNPRHVMHALELPQVTQARVSDDYGPGAGQWKIGISSIFAEALGIAPYKDTFWTTETQTGNPYGPERTEPYHALNAVVSTLSTGPVGPSDKIGATNRALLMKCCNKDGLILKPSKPARAIDKQIMKMAFPKSDGPVGELWSARTDISGLNFANVLGAAILSDFSMKLSDVGFEMEEGAEYYIVPYNSMSGWSLFSDMTPQIFTNSCTAINFCLYHVSQAIPGWFQTVLIGDLDKWVPMSPQRVKKIEWTTDSLIATLSGAPMETFNFTYILRSKMGSVLCSLDTRGEASFRVLGNLGTVECS